MAKNFVDRLFDSDIQLFDLTDGNYEDNVEAPLQEAETQDFDIRTGASKLVIIPAHEEYVIKIPFIGCSRSGYNSMQGDYEYTEEFDKDYCQLECDMYAIAEENFPMAAQMLAKVEFIGDKDGVPIFWQTRCHGYYDECQSHWTSEDSISTARSICDEKNCECFNERWLGQAIDAYGEEAVAELIYFIKKNGINDLHNGNIGYYHGKPIIYDYSGYYD